MAVDQAELRAIGVDVGATRVRAARIRLESDGCLELEALAQTTFPDSGFVPLSLSVQRELVALSDGESDEGRRRCESIARTVREVDPEGHLPVAIAAPGVKTDDGRGILMSRLGPRIPHLATWLEELLRQPVPPLGSDGVWAGVGEERARLGSFRGAARAYYLAAGTGLSEAFKADDQIGPVTPPRYVLAGRDGIPYEDLVSARVWPNDRLLEDLVDLLRARRAALAFTRVVLGGHLRSAVDAGEVSQALETEVLVSRLPYPAVFGAAAAVLK